MEDNSMSGTKAGAAKMVATKRANGYYEKNKEHYRRMGEKSHVGGFGANPELARQMGQRRSKTRTSIRTITTKQFRENMQSVIRILESGQSVRLTYRRKTVGTIQPEPNNSQPFRRGSPEAIQHALKTLDFGVPEKLKGSERSFKEELAELRNKKYGR
jgi:hypothetical protein